MTEHREPGIEDRRDKVLRDVVAPTERFDVDAAWRSVSARMHADQRTQATQRLTRRLAIGAAMAAGLTLVAVGLSRLNVGKVALVELVTGVAEQRTQTLPDGTTITLKAASMLRYPATFGSTREVELEGEAHFRVTHDAQRPFRIHAHRAVITDLGTQLVVRAYRDLGHVDVAVTEGSVSLGSSASATTMVLTPGMVGRVDADGLVTVSTTRRAEDVAAWVQGTLSFDGLPLREVAGDLERRFGVTIAIADSTLAQRRVTTRLKNETLTQVLDALGVALGFTHERAGKTVTLRPR